MNGISEKIRQEFEAGDIVRDAGLKTPEDIERYDDIAYGDNLKWQVLDVYRPRRAEDEVLPVIVSVHGGAWVYGDKERYQYYCMSLAQHGYAVVNFTYRLAPEYKFPAPLEDLNLVIQWIMDHAEQYLFDKEHIFAVGDSAGAHQLALYASICTNEKYARCYKFKIPEKFSFEALALNCGAYQVEKNGEEDLTLKLMEEYLPDKGSEEEFYMINAVNHITEKFPPVFFMTCTGDFLMKQAVALEERLMECKIPHEFHFYGDSEHELGHVFHCNMKMDEAHECNKDECNYFKKFIDKELL